MASSYTYLTLSWPTDNPASVIQGIALVRELGCLRGESRDQFGLMEAKWMVDAMRHDGVGVTFEVPAGVMRLIGPAIQRIFRVDDGIGVFAEDVCVSAQIERGIERLERFANGLLRVCGEDAIDLREEIYRLRRDLQEDD